MSAQKGSATVLMLAIRLLILSLANMTPGDLSSGPAGELQVSFASIFLS